MMAIVDGRWGGRAENFYVLGPFLVLLQDILQTQLSCAGRPAAVLRTGLALLPTLITPPPGLALLPPAYLKDTATIHFHVAVISLRWMADGFIHLISRHL
jgi:hypothetical protein